MNEKEHIHISIIGPYRMAAKRLMEQLQQLTHHGVGGYVYDWKVDGNDDIDEGLEVQQNAQDDASDVVLQIVDCTQLEKSLLQTTELINSNRPTVLLLDKMDQLLATGHSLDTAKLSFLTGLRTAVASTHNGKGLGSVIDLVAEAYDQRLIVGTRNVRIADAEGFVHGLLQETLQHSDDDSDHTRLQKIDAVLTNRWLGFPILIAILYLVFECTFTLGAYPQEWIQSGVDALAVKVHEWMPEAWYTSLLADGIVQGVGAVLAFLPNIVILFLFISLMEDSGYMSRVAFLMDKLMHRVGLHGKSFVPMLVGFGCNVPAIMAAKSIENPKDRTLTMLMIPFMSCGARLPVYMLFVGAFFPKHPALVMMSLYLVGIVLSILFATIMKRTRFFRQKSEDYVSELPAFRKPQLKVTAHHIWERCADYLKKISTVILWASVIIWALEYFPRHEVTSTDPIVARAEQEEQSALASIGRWMEPVMEPLGFDWRMNVCILTGLPAKEAIVSTMGILYHTEDEESLTEALSTGDDFTPAKAYAFMLFVLLYFPCIATIATLRREIGWRWALFTVIHSLLLAWLVAFGVNMLF